MNEIFTQLQTLTGLGQTWLWTAALIFLRVGAVMSLLPAFGEQVVSQRVRLALALAFTAIVAPAVAPNITVSAGNWRAGGAEMLVGLAIGIALRLFILALQIAASIIAQVTSLSQMFAGATPEPQPAIGNLLIMAGLTLAVISGLHVKVASLLILSYDILPAGQLPSVSDMSDWGLSQIIHAFSLAFALAAPFVIGSVVYNVALGIINKAMPQLSVSMVGAPIMTAGALILMFIAAPLILTVWQTHFDAFLALPFQVGP